MKSKLMGIFALASCVMLAGCGNNPGPDPKHEHSFSTDWKSDDANHWHECSCGEKADTAAHLDEDNNGKCDVCSHAVPKKEPVIEIAALPSDLVNGDEIDLADYITVQYGKGSYSINFDDESFAKISLLTDTKIKLEATGTIKFTVDYSGKSKEGTLVVGSAFAKEFSNLVKNAGYDYAEIYQDEYDDYHWENYGEKFVIDLYYSENASGGYLEAPDKMVYSFELDDTSSEFTFSITGNEPEFISDYSKPLALPISGYEVCVEGEGSKAYEYLKLSENDEGVVRNIILDFFNIDERSLDAVLQTYNLAISSFQVIEDYVEVEDGVKMQIFDTYAMVKDLDPESETFDKELWLANTMLSFDKDFFFRDEVQAYIDSGEQPKSSYQLSVDKIAEAVNKHNYTVSYDYGWYDCSVSKDGTRLIRGEKRDDNPFVDELTTGDLIHDYFNAIGSFDAYLGESKTFSDVPHENGYGLINGASGEGFEYNGNSTDGYKASKESTGFDLYDPENDFLYYNYQFLTGVEIEEWPSVYAGLFINNKVDNGDGSYTYTLGGATAVDLFDCLFLESINDGAYPEVDPDGNFPHFSLFDSLNKVAEFILEQGMYVYLDVEITEKYDADALVGLTFDFCWFDADEDYSNYYQYVMTADIDFTQCVMPEFDVNFPSAE